MAKLIKKFGRSVTGADADNPPKNRRRLVLNGGDASWKDVPPFAVGNSHALIGQWISVIDKIAKKPATGKATADQKQFRDRIGTAAWAIFLREGLISEKGVEIDKLKGYWRNRLHPYPQDTIREKDFLDDVYDHVRGRLYSKFCGDEKDILEIDATALAERIYSDLHLAETSHSGHRQRSWGRIQRRAHSIESNVLKPREAGSHTKWTDEDVAAYIKAVPFDVAAKICADAKTCVEQNRRFRSSNAQAVLYEAYPYLFVSPDGTTFGLKAAAEAHPGLFALHQDIKRCYVDLLKRSKRRDSTRVLPKSMGALCDLIQKKSENRDIGHIIREGRIAYYDAAGQGADLADERSVILRNWPDAERFEKSFYWTSDGQADIKRNEAFVRTWRNTISFAQRTFTRLVDPDGDGSEDLLYGETSQFLERIRTGDAFDPTDAARRTSLLFGRRSDYFEGEGRPDVYQLIGLAHHGISALRNQAFHFRGAGAFTTDLRTLEVHQFKDQRTTDLCAKTLSELVRKDRSERHLSLLASLRASHIESYANDHQLRQLVGALEAEPDPTAILPKFKRMLTRAEGVLSDMLGKGQSLPETANRKALEAAPRLCQYKSLQLLYHRAFPNWLAEQTADTFNGWIAIVELRMTNAARQLNATSSNQHQRFAVRAKVTGLVQLDSGETIWDFSDKMMRATASEFKVQQGYTSDREKAREQAKHVENLRCDVISLAFSKFLADQKFLWVLGIDTDDVVPKPAISNLDEVKFKAPVATVQRWEAVLYFLIHFVPVEEVTRLAHQMRKWSGLEIKGSHQTPDESAELSTTRHNMLKRVQDLFNLYIEMHDASMEGGAAIEPSVNLRDFCEDVVLKRAFPESGDVDGRVPLRGLREVERFGGFGALAHILAKEQVRSSHVEQLGHFERPQVNGASTVEKAQLKREKIRKKWENDAHVLTRQCVKSYAESIYVIARHRDLANLTALNTHLKVYSAAIAVHARLIDFAGLWERDIFFAILGILKRKKKSPADIVKESADPQVRKLLLHGNIVKLVRSIKPSHPDLYSELAKRFGTTFERDDRLVEIRNSLAHFRAFQRGYSPDFTQIVNDVRDLMAYDRKLKNAVSKSIIDLLEKHGFLLNWTSASDHLLTGPTVQSKEIKHLKKRYLVERLHGKEAITMMAGLFSGNADYDGSHLAEEGYFLSLRSAIDQDFD